MLQKGHKREVYGEDHVDDGGLLEGHKKDREAQIAQELVEKVLEGPGKPCGSHCHTVAALFWCACGRDVAGAVSTCFYG